jgi:threonine/homoserine/homoserine lactone efflux protein
VLTVSDASDVSSNSDASDGSGGALVAIGVVLILLAFRRWRSRPQHGETPTPPGWMARIDGLNPFAALALGVLFAAINPKNFLLAAAAAVQVGQVGLSTTDTVITWLIFVLIASIGVLIPVVYRLVRGEHAQATLDRAKAWLEMNNAVVMALLFLVFGAKILGNGLSAVS